MEENKQENQNSKQEASKKEAKKEGVALLEEIGLKEVSNKTFINQDNLKALLEKDFEKLNRTKALGFIQILEREFGVNLQELKNESLQFYNAHVKRREQPVRTIESAAQEEQPKKILRYVLLAVLLGFAAYYFWLKSPKTGDDVVSMDLNVVKNEVVTQEAKESLLALDETFEAETNESDEVDLNRVVEEMFKNSDANDTEAFDEANSTSENNTTSMSVLSAKEEKILLEENSTQVHIEVAPKKELQKIVPNVEKKSPTTVKNTTPSGLYIDPIQKAWVGVIFLDTMKKKDYLIRKRLKLDASQDQIILVGHNKFKIYNKKLEQGFKSRKMVRFLYKDGELREISKKEYKSRLGGVRW